MIRKRLSSFQDVDLYCVTAKPREGQTHEGLVESACRGGADIIQLRDKTLSPKDFISLGRALKKVCDQYGALFIVNDRVDVALACDADGVHVGQDDVPVAVARQILGHRKIIGCSTHSLQQAFQAETAGADYVSCGPLFATPTKPDYAPVGLDSVRHYRNVLHIPFVAIGGIDASNVEAVINAGADRAAVVRAVFDQDDVEGAARSLKETIRKAKSRRSSVEKTRMLDRQVSGIAEDRPFSD
ncbi:MAG TPA: thiamine phosphate synthase [Elusimicrobiota bacterium]|nr:thiamine phosphate synthase [Elusimicrobiota bacterium]